MNSIATAGIDLKTENYLKDDFDLEDIKKQWTLFKLKFSKTYNATKDAFRFKVFENNLKRLDKYNDKYDTLNDREDNSHHMVLILIFFLISFIAYLSLSELIFVLFKIKLKLRFKFMVP
jgi:hypothetical protein